jgi:hypothetical protein
MAMKVTPQQDTGWGVIYRLNGLFSEVEVLAPAGKYDDWNFKLDRIWSNLCYREDLDIKRDSNNKIISIEFQQADIEKKQYFDNQIKSARFKMNQARRKVPESKSYKSNPEYKIAKNHLYDCLLMKEIWLRKMMRELKLYLKEIKHNPSGAMWGGD